MRKKKSDVAGSCFASGPLEAMVRSSALVQSSQEPLQPQLSTPNGDGVAHTPGAVAVRSGGTKARSFALVQRSQELERLELPSPDDEEEKSSNNCFAALANHSFVLFGMTPGALLEPHGRLLELVDEVWPRRRKTHRAQ